MTQADMKKYTRPVAPGTDFDAPYVCPDCASGYDGVYLIQQNIQGARIYVCPCCGVLQEINEVERQLGKEN